MMANEIPSMATAKNSSESDEQKPEPVWPAEMVSGTLPIIYIDTENNDSIVDKERKNDDTALNYRNGNGSANRDDMGAPYATSRTYTQW